MRHHATTLKPMTDHWAVSWSGKRILADRDSVVLVQLQEDGNQARVALTADEADAMARQLVAFAQKVRETNQVAAAPASLPADAGVCALCQGERVVGIPGAPCSLCHGTGRDPLAALKQGQPGVPEGQPLG